MNVLIVDDKIENRYLLEALLKGHGHVVQSAFNGAEALEMLQAEGFDLVISDILMPVMDGFQLCRKVKTDEALRHIPFIVYTATYTGPKDEEFAMKIGADRFIQKPCEPDVFMRAVQEVMAAAEKREDKIIPETPAQEEEILKLYSERLVRKLEQKMLELEKEMRMRQEAEETLRANERKYRLLADNTLDVIWSMNPNLEFTYVNPAIRDLTGHSPEEWIGTPLSEHCDAANLEKLARVISEAVAKGPGSSGVVVETELLKKNGDPIPIEVHGQAIFDENGQPVMLQGVTRDITERKQAEEALRESEKRHRSVLENSGDAIFLTSPRGRIFSANPAACRMFGYTEEEFLDSGQKIIIDPDDPQLIAGLEERFRYGNFQGELTFIRKNGEAFPGEVNSTVFQGPEGQLLATVIVRDITERKRAEEEQEKLQAQFLQAQKMESVGRLAGGVAHDFNNMLQIILGHVEMALPDATEGGGLQESLLEIQKAASRSADLTRQLLAFARRQTVVPRVLDMNETVEGMLKMLKRLIGEDIDLLWLPGENLWTVKMDPSQIDQILANLSVNARDAIGGTGKVTIETRNITFDEAYCDAHSGFLPGQYIMLTVSDDGCGMDPATLDHIFEPFFTTKKEGEGTGLGLATVYGIAKQNEGFINVYSEPGKGTTIKIYMPRFEGEAEAWAETAEEAPRGHGETMLLVEDEASILDLGQKMLERLGYTVLTADAPEEALRLAQTHPGDIHLLITDVVLPDMNGKELAERIVSIKPGLKCLYMSGYSANAIAHRGVLDPGAHFLQKPFSLQDLASKVDQALHR